MPRDIYQVAASSLLMNERLRSFDVEYQKSERSCLGTAAHLEMDAVRFVLTGDETNALKCFESAVTLSEAAVAGGETWVYDNAQIASFFAYRQAFVAAWAIGSERASAFADRALTTFDEIATPADYLVEHPNHAITATLLLAIHAGLPERLLSKLAISRRCAMGHGWCRCFEIAFSFARGLGVVAEMDAFFDGYVRAPDAFHIVGSDFPLTTAISFASIRSVARSTSLRPFEVIMSLRHAAA